MTLVFGLCECTRRAICVSPGDEEIDLSRVVWGVSRMGSGSHVMACVLCRQRGWEPPQFLVCNDFAGLRSALSQKQIGAFLWEFFTTRPFQTAGHLTFAGEVPTPWGCFCAVVAHPPKIDIHEARSALHSVLNACVAFEEDSTGDSIRKVEEMSGMTSSDAMAWHKAVNYAHPDSSMPTLELELARDTVKTAGLVGSCKYASVLQYLV